jgi:hypothetical protein
LFLASSSRFPLILCAASCENAKQVFFAFLQLAAFSLRSELQKEKAAKKQRGNC